MRSWAPAVGACLLLWAAESAAVAPIDPARPGSGPAAPAGPAPRRAPQKPPDVDRPERARALTTGQWGALVILVQFPDWPADTLGHPSAAFDSLLFSQGVSPTGSFREYYNEISRGTFDIDGFVTPWITAPRNYGEYTAGSSGFGPNPNNAQGMVEDALSVLDADLSFDFTQFDNDGPDGSPNSDDDDGFIDALFVVHAGPGDEEMGTGGHIYSHKWNLVTPFTTHDGIRAFAYTTEPEEWFGTAPYTQPGEIQSIGVFCHEFGHVLGLPDLYDTTPTPLDSEGIGEWDLMGSGSYNHLLTGSLGTTPAHMSAWSKIRLGWATPIVVSQDVTGVTLPPVETTGTVYRLSTDGVTTFDYFLVENRQLVGFDAALVRGSVEAGEGPAHGLMIYHVNDAVLGNGDPANKQVDVVESGGAEEAIGAIGAQNLDLKRGVTGSQSACGATISVTGNRGDRYDPWPGPFLHAAFSSSTCPNSATSCGFISHVAIHNVAETGPGPFDVTADFYVESVSLRRHGLVVDDTPFDGHQNNGNGLAEPGETVRLRLPIENRGTQPTAALTGVLASQDLYTTLAGSALAYGAIAPGAVDSGAVIEASVNAAPDPSGASLGYSIFSPVGLVDADSVQMLVGLRSGICDDFEGTSRRWVGVPVACLSPNQWHRETGQNHTPDGAWAWRLGPVGPFGNYAPAQDARLMSQPIRLGGANDTLAFWHRYATEVGFDGVSVEISTDGGAMWSLLTPVGGYPSGDRYSGLLPVFAQAKVALTGHSGLVQIGFRFRSTPPIESVGYWLDDVVVTGDAECATTAIAVSRFTAAPTADGRAVRIEWTLADAAAATVGIDRAAAGGPRERLVTRAVDAGDGFYEDRTVAAGLSYDYWLVAAHEGEPAATAGPVRVTLPGSPVPRVLALGTIRPNPFNPRAVAPVELDRAGRIVLRVRTVDGKPVRTLADGYRPAGRYEIPWDGTDERGADVGSGVYVFELRSEQHVRVRKAILLR